MRREKSISGRGYSTYVCPQAVGNITNEKQRNQLDRE